MTGIDPVEVFRQEAAELLATLEETLLDLESRPQDSELVGLAFRSLHTLKGSGAMFGFTAVADFIHQFETAFDRIRKGEAGISDALIKAALRAGDHVGRLIEDTANPEDGAAILAVLVAALDPQAESAPAPPEHWRIHFRLPPDALVNGTNPLLLLEELRGLGPCEITADATGVPTLENLEATTCYLAWDIALNADASREAIDDVFLFVRDDMELTVEKIGATPAAPTESESDLPETAAVAAVDPRGADQGSTRIERTPTIRVPAERLDHLMDRVGELVIAQARLSLLAQASHMPALVGVAEEIERLTASLRDTTMGTRMVPIGSLFGRFRRLVHDLSQELGKPIEFIAEGEDTELDKTVIEQLADPLVHLIRNAVDHGLENPDARLAQAKSPAGTLRLIASQRGAEVAITVADDGAGLNSTRIRQKAEAAGLIAENAVIAEADLHAMIFEAGFSTASEVTALSGRGVGMDVVKRAIESLRGSIDIASKPGIGTSITLRLPLTLAIIDGLLIRVGDARYVIPLTAVEECIELVSDPNTDSHGRSFLNLRGDLVPYLHLRDVFSTSSEPDAYQKIVVVSSGGARVGLVVDQIIGNNQTVIKQLSRLHRNLKTFSGATILGDGTVALILDVMNLISFGQAMEQSRRNDTLGRAA